MMTFFEVSGRLRNLLEFRRLYREYMEFTNKETNVAAQTVRSKLEPLAAMTIDSLRRVGLGAIITRETAAANGRKVRINLIKALFHDDLVEYYHIHDREILTILDSGIAKYKVRKWAQTMQLFNPIFWVFQLGGLLADLPFMMFRRSGYDTDRMSELTSLRLYRLIVQFAFLFALLKVSGLLDSVRFDLLAL